MKRKTKLILSGFFAVMLLFAMVFPCSAFVSDIEDSLVVNYVYGSVDSTFTDYYQYAKETITPGETTEYLATLAKREIVPNYFFHQFNITSSNGLPVAEGGKTWKFAISNFSDYIRIDTANGGFFYLQSIGDCYIRFKYSNGYWSGLIKDNTVGFTYDSNTNKHSLNFKIKPQNAVDIQEVEIKYFCDYSDFGLSRFTADDDLMEYYYVISFNNFLLSREEVFPTADGSALNDFVSQETELIDSTQSGIQEARTLINTFKRVFVPSSSIYRGAMFFGNLLRDFTSTIPDFSNIVLVSLAIGINMVLLGSVLFSIVGRRHSANSVKSDKKTKGG